MHWHPLPVPFPWRGGNNIVLKFTRLVGYPDLPQDEGDDVPVLPTCHVTLEGCMFVDDLTPPAGPPSTGMLNV